MNCDNTGEEGERAGNLFPVDAEFLFLPRRVVGDDKQCVSLCWGHEWKTEVEIPDEQHMQGAAKAGSQVLL